MVGPQEPGSFTFEVTRMCIGGAKVASKSGQAQGVFDGSSRLVLGICSDFALRGAVRLQAHGLVVGRRRLMLCSVQCGLPCTAHSEQGFLQRPYDFRRSWAS
ncbi:hypothetical protein LIA77_09554 [Sarocladium implicatum]|nr:hypothetical protein LIA77_09554 [Sarocladium implicatum]